MSVYRLLNKGVTLAIAALLSQGCSNHFVQAVGPSTSTIDQTTSYFPLEEGFQVVYQVSSTNGALEYITYTVGNDVSFLGATATIWIVNNDGQKDTSYFVENGNALLFYEEMQSEPERVLDLPLTLGKTWSRIDIPESQTIDTSGAGDNNLSKDSTSGENGVSLASSFPTEGMALMTVDRIESVVLSNGNYYSGVVRVSNDAGANTRNYYWYAPGIGMIKYILGGINPENPTGGIQAELISYGYTF